MPDQKKKKIRCKVCPKKSQPCRVNSEPLLKDNALDTSEEEEVSEEHVCDKCEEEEEEEEEEEDVSEEEYSCLEEGEAFKEIATAKYLLNEIFPTKKKPKPPFFCSTAPKSRYENMVPTDVTNDHQDKATDEKTVLEHLSSLRVTSEPFCKRQTAIIATIGPSCLEVNEIEDLLDSGMNIARINMAYGDRCCQLNAIQNFKVAVKNYRARIGWKITVGLLMDLKGPEIRTGRICRFYACDPENPQILIEKGSLVKLTTDVTFMDKCTPNLIYIDFALFPDHVRPGMKIYIGDGLIQLSALEVTENEIKTVCEIEGYLGNNLPIHLPMVPIASPAITSIDAEDIELAVEEEFDFIVLPKVQSAEIIQDLKTKLFETLLTHRKLREKSIMILVKVSNYHALSNIDEIIEASDGIVIQRGDLGLELPLEKIFVAQREIIGKCNLANKPVICSTQLMKSMTRKPLADSSNIFDVSSCLEDGADCVCLTGETAIGFYPAETVEQTHYILKEAEAAGARKYHFKEIVGKLKPPIEPVIAVGMAACIVAEKIKATTILVITKSGKSAQVISWFRPRCIVLAITRFERVANRLNLWRSICPLIYTGPCIKNQWFDDLDLKFQFGIAFGKEVGFIKSGDPLVLVCGYDKDTTFTNFVRVVYASTQPGVYLQHSKEFYDNIYLQNDFPRSKNKDPCRTYI